MRRVCRLNGLILLMGLMFLIIGCGNEIDGSLPNDEHIDFEEEREPVFITREDLDNRWIERTLAFQGWQADLEREEITREGDWIIAGNETLEAKLITLNGNLIIKEGGSLALKNTLITVNSDFRGEDQYSITAGEGSTLHLINSKVLPSGPSSPNFFNIESDTLILENSWLDGAGRIHHVNNLAIRDSILTYSAEESVMLHIEDIVSAEIVGNSIGSSEGDIIVWLGSFRDSDISNNYFHSPTIHVRSGWNNTITNNIIDVAGFGGGCGLLMDGECGYNLIDGNTFNAYPSPAGACTAARLLNTTHPNAFTNNVIDGYAHVIPQDGIHSYFATGIILAQVSNAIVANNRFIYLHAPGDGGHLEAIQVVRSDNNYILNNYMARVNSGITLFASANNTLKGNRVIDSGRGIGLYYSSNSNVLENNYLEGNLINLILDDARDNTLSGNQLISGELQAYDNSSNSWKSNYWSDYTGAERSEGIGDIPHTISTNASDEEPLIAVTGYQRASVPSLDKPTAPYVRADSGPPALRDSMGNLLQANGLEYKWGWGYFKKSLTLEDTELNISGEEFTIETGATLTLNNVTLTASGGALIIEIIIQPGASLHIRDSRIIGGERGPSISFEVMEGASLVIENSELYNLGHPITQVGPMIRTSSADIILENNTIVGAKYLFEGLSGGRVVNNTISKCYGGMSICPPPGGNMIITGNIISQVINGSLIIGCTDGKMTLADNEISNVWGYIEIPEDFYLTNELNNYLGGFQYPSPWGYKGP